MKLNQTHRLLGLALLVYLYFQNRQEVQEVIKQGVKKMTQPRGIRNNNPGNLRISNIAWQGKIQGEDKSFETFENAEYGIRALGKTLLTYNSKHGLNTVNDIINRYAPPVENNTNAYAEHVAKYLGVGLHEKIDVRDRIFDLVTVIIMHENGYNPYPTETLNRGVSMALA